MKCKAVSGEQHRPDICFPLGVDGTQLGKILGGGPSPARVDRKNTVTKAMKAIIIYGCFSATLLIWQPAAA